MAKNKNTKTNKKAWNETERREFADGVRLRAQRIPNKKRIASRDACRRWSAD